MSSTKDHGRPSTLPASSSSAAAATVREEPIADLLDRCQRDERDAKRLLYERYSEMVYALMFRIVGQQDAADVAQEVFLQVFRKLHQFRGGSDFRTWLYRVAVNEALQHQRKRKRRTFAPLQVEPIDSDAEYRRTEHRELLEQALDAIPADLRAIFVLREVEALSYRQISQVLRISEGTVASRISRARSELKAVIRRLGWEFA